MVHRYRIGQMLEMRSSPRTSNRPAGPCEVLFCLPHDRGPVLYRVKSRGENNDRIVDELDLAPSTTPRAEPDDRPAQFTIAVSRR